jgi:hypothetical protein
MVLDRLGEFAPSASTIGLGINLVLGTVVLCVLAYAAYYLWQQFQYKHTVIFHKQFGGKKKQYVFDKAWIKEEEGQIYWELKSNKRQIEAPPDEVLEQRSDGTYVANASIDTKDTVMWLETTFDFEAAKQRDDYQPASTESRMSVLRNLERNKQLRGKSWFSENAATIVSGIVLVMVMVGGAYGYKIVMEPALEATDAALRATENLAQYGDALRELSSNTTDLNQATNTTAPGAPN